MKENAVVAFRPKGRDEYYTGYYKDLGKGTFMIKVILPIQPQWFEKSDKTVYFYDEIDDIIEIK